MTTAIRAERVSSGKQFAIYTMTLCLVAAALSGCAPIAVSVGLVFLFAGPHNWLEFRYFISRLPSSWGPFKSFFLFSCCGIAVLTLSYITMAVCNESLTGQTATLVYSTWYSLLVVWVVGLIRLRSRHRPRRDWTTCLSVALLVLSAIWAAPSYFGLTLVFLHPLMGLWILEREINRKRPGWRKAYHACLWLVPLCLGFIWCCSSDTSICSTLVGISNLESDHIAIRTAERAGFALLPDIPTHLLISSHAFLEMLHYGVWLLAIPAASGIFSNWNVANVPIARKSALWKSILIGATAAATMAVIILWIGLSVDYATVRDVYFTIAIAHVLAEVPLLLWTI